MQLSTKNKLKYKRFSINDIKTTISMKKYGYSLQKISDVIEFDKSTISRNLNKAKIISYGKIKVNKQWIPREKIINYSLREWISKNNYY